MASGFYFVRLSVLPSALQEIFIDQTRADNAAMPGSRTWEGALFRQIFNDYYATTDEWIADDTSTVNSAALPPLVQTMAIVGDDEQELTYHEWIFQQTGFNLPTEGCQQVSRRNSRAGLSNLALMDGHGAAFGHFEVSHTHSVQMNLAAKEPSFIVGIIAVQEEPNSGTSGGATGDSTTTAGGLYPDANEWDFEKLRNQNGWIARLDDGTTDIGDIGSEATINLFEQGEVRFYEDWNPVKLTSQASDTIVDESSEGAETYSALSTSWLGASILTDIGLF